MTTPAKLRNGPPNRRFYPYQHPHCNHSSLPSHNGTGIWQPFNATNSNSDGSHRSNPLSMGGSHAPNPIWLFPNGTAVMNGTILGLPNGTACANPSFSNRTAPISSTGTTTKMTPATRPNSDGEIIHSGIVPASAFTTEIQTTAAALTSSSSIPASAMIPAIIIPLIVAVLLVVALVWCCRYRKHKKPEDSEKAYPGPSDSMDFSSNARLSRPPQDPAYVAWIDSPQQQTSLLPPPPRVYRTHPRASSYYPSDHNHSKSPVVSAYEESIRDSTRSPRRNSAVSALDYHHGHAPLPALRDTQGHFMPQNFYDGKGYGYVDGKGVRESRVPVGNVDAFLSPPRPSLQGNDGWGGNGGGAHGENNRGMDGRFF